MLAVESSPKDPKTSLEAAREAYFASAVGRSPLPQRPQYAPMTPRRGTINRAAPTGDAAKDAANNNIQLKGALMEGVEAQLASWEGTLAFVGNKKDKMQQLLRAGAEEGRALAQGYRWAVAKGYTEEDVQREASLRLSIGDIRRRLARPRHAPNSNLMILLDQLSAQERMSRVGVHDARLLLKGADIHVDTSVPADATLPTPTLSEVLIGAYEFAHVDVRSQGKEELARTEAERDRLKKQIRLHQSELDQLISEGRNVQAETTHKRLLETQSQLLELLAQRNAILNLSNTDISEFAKEKDQLMRDCRQLGAQFRKDKSAVGEDAAADIRRCEELRSKLDLKVREAVDTYAQAEATASNELRKNEAQQQAVIDEMLAAAKKLVGLGEARKQLVAADLRAREEKERTTYEANELRERTEAVLASIRKLKAYCDDELVLADAIDQYFVKMQQRLDNRRFDTDLADVKRVELEGLKEEYRGYVFSAGDYVTRKHHRFDALERQLRLAKLQRDTIKECLDPDRERYEADIERLGGLLQETEAALLVVEGQQDHAQQLVAPGLAELEAVAGPFIHPSVEYADKAVADRRVFVDKTLRFVEEEERAVEAKKGALAKLKEQVTQEQQQHEQNSIARSRQIA